MAQKKSNIEYQVVTDLPPEALNFVGLEIFRMWTEFALGARSLGGYTIQNPTGRYATSIKYERTGPNTVTITANESLAPEAGIFETGHGPIDLKQYPSLRGRRLPMHRGTGPNYHVGRKLGPQMWAAARRAGSTGFATVPSTITAENADSWIIPSMPAYAPAGILATLLAAQYGRP